MAPRSKPKNDDTPQAGITDETPDSVASPADNASLEHTDGGATTRDTMDAGVPMTQGQPDEPVGPEDAFGPGPKRGDYSGRKDAGPHLESVAIPDDERRAAAQKIADDSDGALTVDQALAEVPRFKLVDQGIRTQEVGDEAGKGGVSTAAATA